ncbi:AAA family ATPase, partial [Streptomyces caeruleatus]
QKATVKLSELAGWKVGQVAPTGRAAQVMQSYTGIESSTLHKRFKVNQVINGEPVEAGGIQAQEQVLLIDECSMIDIVAG